MIDSPAFLTDDERSSRTDPAGQTHDYFLVTHGKSAALASFQTETPLALRRGDPVLVRTGRGLEIGAVLGPASVQQSRLIGHGGALVRRLTARDSAVVAAQRAQSDRLFAEARRRAAQLSASFEVLDVDLAFDESEADLLVVAAADVDAAPLVAELEATFSLRIRLYNLAGDMPSSGKESCGRPDCGSHDADGCSSCGSGGCATGGCATGCGSADVDLRPYFAHLREQMHEQRRVPLA